MRSLMIFLLFTFILYKIVIKYTIFSGIGRECGIFPTRNQFFKAMKFLWVEYEKGSAIPFGGHI